MALSYDSYTKMLRVNKHRLDDELEIQSDVLNEIGEELARQGAREAQAKDDLDSIEAEIYVELTDKASTTKMTKDQAQANIQLDPDRIRLWKAYQIAKTEKARWQSLYEAWKARGFDMKALGQLYTDQYFAIDSAGVATRRRGQDEHTRVRAEVGAARQRRRVE